MNREHGVVFCRDIQIHLLELPKFQRRLDELQGPLEHWLYFLRHAADLDADDLPEVLQVPYIERAARELKMMTQDQLEKERYEARLKAQRDMSTSLKVAMQEGMEKGMEKGRQEGRHEGMLIGGVHFCQRILGQPVTPADELVALPPEELKRLAERLEAEVQSR